MIIYSKMVELDKKMGRIFLFFSCSSRGEITHRYFCCKDNFTNWTTWLHPENDPGAASNKAWFQEKQKKPKQLPSARIRAALCVLSAMCLSPWGPWYSAYIAAMLASRAWESEVEHQGWKHLIWKVKNTFITKTKNKFFHSCLFRTITLVHLWKW